MLHHVEFGVMLLRGPGVPHQHEVGAGPVVQGQPGQVVAAVVA
jgi:hypothetical protein